MEFLVHMEVNWPPDGDKLLKRSLVERRRIERGNLLSKALSSGCGGSQDVGRMSGSGGRRMPLISTTRSRHFRSFLGSTWWLRPWRATPRIPVERTCATPGRASFVSDPGCKADWYDDQPCWKDSASGAGVRWPSQFPPELSHAKAFTTIFQCVVQNKQVMTKTEVANA